MVLVSLLNLGNTCYFNSVIQLFIYDSTFYNKIKNNEIVELFDEIKSEIAIEDNKKGKIYRPIKLLGYFKSKIDSFVGFQQQDSHDFLMSFIDLCFQDSDPYIYGKTSTKVKCVECENISQRIEDYSTINLFVSDEPTNLVNLIKGYLKIEHNNDQNNLYRCDRCNKNTISMSKIDLKKVPQRLIFVLKRYNNDGSKKQTEVDIPMSLNLFVDQVTNRYSLTGVVCHVGTYNKGHYYSDIKIDKDWYQFDDELINIYSDYKPSSTKSYILYYTLNQEQ